MTLPRSACPRAAGIGPVAADPVAWCEQPSVALVDAVTGQPPAQATCVQAVWNEEALRVLFTVEDSEIQATMRVRDMPLYEEEVVEIFLDPVGDAASYFEIELNPLGTVLDLVLRRTQSGYRKDFRWRCEGLETAVSTIPGGWCGELLIPFAALGSLRPAPGSIWRVNFYRIDRTGTERALSAWSPTGHPNFHIPDRFGFFDFET